MNYLIVFCLYLASDVQISAWRSAFANSSNVDVLSHSTRMRSSTWICLIVNSLAVFCHALCVFGLDGMIRLWRRVTFLRHVEVFYISVSFSIIFVCFICPSKEAQTMVNNVFQVRSSSSFQFTSSIVHWGWIFSISPSEFDLHPWMCHRRRRCSTFHCSPHSPSIQTTELWFLQIWSRGDNGKSWSRIAPTLRSDWQSNAVSSGRQRRRSECSTLER